MLPSRSTSATELGRWEQRAFRSIILQLHSWGEEEHPNLTGRDEAPAGHGILVWFEVDDFDAAVEQARKLRATVVEEPHVNPAPRHREMWLRDPDGYYVVLASCDGEATCPGARRFHAWMPG